MKQKLDIVSSKVWEFNSIKMGFAVTSYPQLNAKYSAANNNDTVRLHMGLKGDYAFTYGNLGKSFDLIGGHHNIMYSEGINLEIENKSSEIETFGIEYPKDIFVDLLKDEDPELHLFCTKVLSGQSVIFSETWGSITSPIQNTIDEIITNPYNGKLQDLYLYAKSIELLVLCIANYKHTGAKGFIYLKSKADHEAIIAARDFINSRVADPPDLSEIARAVGVNEFKLKHGFKEMFGSTLFGYLTEKRLHLATLLLKDTSKPLSTIAEELGYSSPQHFSSQYKNRFGKSPSEIRRAS
jgi:AraC-like DNA-binding protein